MADDELIEMASDLLELADSCMSNELAEYVREVGTAVAVNITAANFRQSGISVADVASLRVGDVIAETLKDAAIAGVKVGLEMARGALAREGGTA